MISTAESWMMRTVRLAAMRGRKPCPSVCVRGKPERKTLLSVPCAVHTWKECLIHSILCEEGLFCTAPSLCEPWVSSSRSVGTASTCLSGMFCGSCSVRLCPPRGPAISLVVPGAHVILP
ncbi:unnamed protein product, partial [Discosporangium mesarthrocarpum]